MKINLRSTARRGNAWVMHLSLFLMLLCSFGVWGQTTLVNYKFENNLTAEAGSVGSPILTSSTTVSYFVGVTGQAVAYATSSGKYFDLVISTLGYNNIDISLQGRSSQTNSTWVVTGDSTGGNTFSAITSLNCANGSFTALTPTTIGGSYDNKSSIKIRITGGGTSATLRLDDLIIRGTASVITSTISGIWNSTSTWVGGVVPTAADNVVIASGHTVTLATATNNTRDSGTTTIVNGTLATDVQYINKGTTTINGTFQLNNGGYSNTDNNFVYGANGSLNFNNSGGFGVNNGDQFWPTSNGPFNVNILQGGMTLNSANRTVGGTFQTAAGVSLSSATLTLNGINQINPNGFFNNTPTYGSASTLVYNATFGVDKKWTGNGAVGLGFPQNFTVQAGTLSLPNVNRGIPGTISINSGTTLNLNNVSGDLYIGGNWTDAGNFNPNGRAVFFNGTANQTVTKTGGETFNYLVNNKSAGNLILGNNVTINGSAGDVLQLLNAGLLDLNGQTLTLNNTNGNISVNATGRTITSGIVGGVLSIAGNKFVTGPGNLTTAANVTVLASAGIDFGVNKTTVNGTFQINNGGFANNNAPIYGSSSTLIYNVVSGYNVGNEWTANALTAGAGTPQNVTLTGSSVNMPNSARSLAGNLTIDTGSALNLNGTFGSDLSLGGNWSKLGTGAFTSNNSAVFFRGAAAQTLSGATTFDYLTLNNTLGLTLQTSSSVIVNKTLDFTTGKITIGANDLTIGSTGTITGASTANFVVTNANGQLKRTVGATNILFAVGNTAYNPITFNNSGTSDVYGIRVSNAAPAAADATKIVTRQWITSEAVAGGSNLAVVAQYNTGEFGAPFTAGIDPFIGLYNGIAYTQVAATLGGGNPFTATSTTNLGPADLTTGTQYFAVGKDNGLISVANKLVITAITPTSPIAGSGFNVTVRSQDKYGAFSNVSANTNYTLTSNGNGGAIGGTVTGTINAIAC